MSHYSHLSLINNFDLEVLRWVFCFNLVHQLFNVPNLNGIIFTRAHKLIPFLWRKVYATNVHGMPLKNRHTLDLVEDRCIRVVVPKSALVVFRPSDDKILKFINRNDDVGMTCQNLGVSGLQIDEFQSFVVWAENSMWVWIHKLEIDNFVEIKRLRAD